MSWRSTVQFLRLEPGKAGPDWTMDLAMEMGLAMKMGLAMVLSSAQTLGSVPSAAPVPPDATKKQANSAKQMVFY